MKSHIVLGADVALLLDEEDQEGVKLAIHTVAHECAHVEITAAYDKSFPDDTLRKFHDTIMESWRWDVISACWDEYAACRIAAAIGYDPLPGYETFVLALNQTDDKVVELIRRFDGGGADPLVGPVFGAYGTMMKFACYMLGAMAAAGKTLSDCDAAQRALCDHWLLPIPIN